MHWPSIVVLGSRWRIGLDSLIWRGSEVLKGQDFEKASKFKLGKPWPIRKFKMDMPKDLLYAFSNSPLYVMVKSPCNEEFEKRASLIVYRNTDNHDQ